MNSQMPPYMPRVDQRDNLEQIFGDARKMAGQRQPDGSSQITVVTPGRSIIMPLPCPRAGSMSPQDVAGIERVIPANPPQQVTVIAFTELQTIGTEIATIQRAIPFLGYLLGFGYSGHNVVIFEGHISAFQTGCKNANVLIVDDGMIPHLHERWVHDAYAVMRPGARIIVFGPGHKLRVVPPPSKADPAGQSGSSDALFRDAMALMQQEDWDGTIRTLTEAIKVDPTQFDSYAYRALALTKKKNFQLAIEDYNEAIRLSPREMEVYTLRGDVYVALQTFEEAISDYTRAIKLQPDNAKYYTKRAKAYERAGAIKQALADFTKVIELEPQNERGYTDRGLLRTKMDDPDGAIADFSRSIKINPGDPFAYVFRSEAYANKKDYKAALADYETYIRSGLPQKMGKLQSAEQRLQQLKELAKGSKGGLFRR
jgi:Tfp pilus assembly protein PilF